MTPLSYNDIRTLMYISGSVFGATPYDLSDECDRELCDLAIMRIDGLITPSTTVAGRWVLTELGESRLRAELAELAKPRVVPKVYRAERGVDDKRWVIKIVQDQFVLTVGRWDARNQYYVFGPEYLGSAYTNGPVWYPAGASLIIDCIADSDRYMVQVQYTDTYDKTTRIEGPELFEQLGFPLTKTWEEK